MKTKNLVSVVGLALAAASASAQTNAVSPNSRATTEGNDSNAYPFCAPNVDRYQQVFGAGSLSTLVNKQITHIAFRLDGPSAAYSGAFEYTSLTIKLSTSTRTPDQLQTVLDQNVGANVRTVYDGPFTVPNLSNSGSPHPWDMVIALQTPFAYTGGPLLLEISGPIGPGPTGNQFFLDAEQTTGDSVSRAYSTTAEAIFTDTRGLICRFTAEPIPSCYANCDNSTIAPALNINDFICFQTRFALGDTWANCDGSTVVPSLNINDFICFQTRYTLGCP